MPQTAQCSGCSRRVQLTPDGQCPNGHMRSMLRDVREGELAIAAVSTDPVTRSGPVVSRQSEHDELIASVLGKSIVLVPLGLLAIFALWTGYLEAVGSGTPAGMAVVISIGSFVLTVGGVYVWFALKKRKH